MKNTLNIHPGRWAKRVRIGSNVNVSPTLDYRNQGKTAEQIDAILIALAALGLSGETIDIRGNFPRTSASDTAYNTLTVTQDNEVLEDVNLIELSASAIDENNIIGQVVGILSALNDDYYTYTYSLVAAYGDNASFDIDSPNLEAGEVYDYETKSTYDIKIRATNEYYYFEQVFEITINDVAEYPAILNDGHTKIWGDPTELSSITKDESNRVSSWADKLLSGVAFTQSTDDLKFIYSAAGLTADGSDDYMQTAALTFNQPATIYLVINIVSFVNYERIFEGLGANTILFMRTDPNGIVMDAGTASTRETSLVQGTTGIVRIVLNGASSKLQVNENAAVEGNFGANAIGGILLAARKTIYDLNANIIFKDVIFRDIADGSTDYDSIYTYLKTKWGL